MQNDQTPAAALLEAVPDPYEVLGRMRAADASIKAGGRPEWCCYCGGPLPEPSPGQPGSIRRYCKEKHREKAHALTRGMPKSAALPPATTRHVSYGGDVVTAVRDLSARAADLRGAAEQLDAVVARAADLQGCQALIEGAEMRLQRQERELHEDLMNEIRARLAAQDLMHTAESNAELEQQRADAADQARVRAEEELERIRLEFAQRCSELDAEMARVRSKADEDVAFAQKSAAEAEAERDRQVGEFRDELERAKASAAEQVRQAQAAAARAEAARAAAEGEAERARAEVDRARVAAERERERGEERVHEEGARGKAELARAVAAAKAVEDSLRERIQLLEHELGRERKAREQAEEERRGLSASLQRAMQTIQTKEPES